MDLMAVLVFFSLPEQEFTLRENQWWSKKKKEGNYWNIS